MHSLTCCGYYERHQTNENNPNKNEKEKENENENKYENEKVNVDKKEKENKENGNNNTFYFCCSCEFEEVDPIKENNQIETCNDVSMPTIEFGLRKRRRKPCTKHPATWRQDKLQHLAHVIPLQIVQLKQLQYALDHIQRRKNKQFDLLKAEDSTPLLSSFDSTIFDSYLKDSYDLRIKQFNTASVLMESRGIPEKSVG